jgi:hypothetical protein
MFFENPLRLGSNATGNDSFPVAVVAGVVDLWFVSESDVVDQEATFRLHVLHEQRLGISIFY